MLKIHHLNRVRVLFEEDSAKYYLGCLENILIKLI